jgi:hypothetical protein
MTNMETPLMFILFGIPPFIMVHDSFSAIVIALFTVLPALFRVYIILGWLHLICDGRVGSSRRILERRGGPGKRALDGQENIRLVSLCTHCRR